MTTKQKIYDFAVRWLEKYRSNRTTEQEVFDGFADECVSLGFEMDCGNSFEEVFPDTNAFKDCRALNKIIDQVEDIGLLTSAIFSKWRYITYWSGGESLLSDKNRPWFILAFSHLAVLTSENKASSSIFQRQVHKIQIVSNSISYGPCPEPDEEVEQHLTVYADGRVLLSRYCYGDGNTYKLARSKNFSIAKEAATRILHAVETVFSDGYKTVFATDIGVWNMTVTDTDRKAYQFEGSLCCDFDAGGMDLSDLIRNTLDIQDLFLFDGNCKPDKVNKITVRYHRVTKIKPKVPISETVDTCTWDYSEQLIVDRKSETMEHVQRIGSGCIISRKYYVQEGIVGLLDNLDANSLFSHITGNGPDVVSDPDETRDYEITVDFQRRPQFVICGTYDKNGLPEDWPEFAEHIWDFIRFYGLGEILAPSTYGKIRRKIGDYIFCSVEFGSGGKSYYYLTEDDALSVDDLVIVPVGKDGHTATARIVDIEYFQEDKVPFPLDKVKRIIRKCAPEDLKEQEQNGAQE